MKNGKTVDPRDKASPKVLQLETAMGAAIQCFPGAQVRGGRRRATHGAPPPRGSTPSHPSPAGDLRASLALRAGKDDG